VGIVKMSKTQYIIAGASPDLLTPPAPVPFPSIASLQLRLRPDLGMVSAGGIVTSWTDQSSNVGVFTKHPSATASPTVGDLTIPGGKTVPAVQFVAASQQGLQNSSGAVWIPNSSWFNGLVMLAYYWPTWSGSSLLYNYEGPSRYDSVMMGVPQQTGANYRYLLNIYGASKNSTNLANPETKAHCMFMTTLISDTPAKSVAWYDSDDGSLGKAPSSVAMNNNCTKVDVGIFKTSAWMYGAGYILELNVWNQTVSILDLVLLKAYVTDRYGITFA